MFDFDIRNIRLKQNANSPELLNLQSTAKSELDPNLDAAEPKTSRQETRQDFFCSRNAAHFLFPKVRIEALAGTQTL